MDLELKILLDELIQGKELTEQLREQIQHISSAEKRQFLVEKILSCYDKALSLLNWETTNFADQECVDNPPKRACKKRKTQHGLTEQVKICSEIGLQGLVDDGYNWRKYGQKDILGAIFPRGYYRCTHRNSQGCLATKQVQRSDKDPLTFKVTYKGRHTCFQSSVTNDKSELNNDSFDQFEQQEEKLKPITLKQSFFNFKEDIKVQELEPVDDVFPAFSFPDANNNIFMMETNSLGSFSSGFLSSTTSDFSASPSQMHNETMSEPDSIPASVNKSPMEGWDVLIDFLDFEADFPVCVQ